jgi:hypothetical protein
MARLFVSKWLRPQAQGTSPRPTRRSLLRLEVLEDRFAPAVVNWTGAGDGINWSDPHNWSTGALPTSADDAFIATDPSVTIRHAGGSDSVHSLHSENALNLSGGSLALAAASAIDSTLTLSSPLATFTANGDLALVDLVQNSGTFTGIGTVTISDLWTWASGNASGTGHTVLSSTAEADLSGGFFSMLIDRTVDNSGSAFVADNSGFDFQGGAVWNNQPGSLFVLGDQSSLGNFFAGPSAGFHNQSAVEVESPSGSASVNVAFTNTGAVDVEAGTLSLGGGGSSAGNIHLADGTVLNVASNFTLQAGATVTGPGTVQVPIFETLTVAGNLAMQNLSLTGGTVTANGNLTLRDLTEAGNLNGPGTVTINDLWAWTSGNMTGPGRTVLNGQATLTGGFFSMLDGRTVDNRGSAVATGGGFDFRNNAVWNNQSSGTFVLMDGASLGNFFAAATAQFNNAGLLDVEGSGAAAIAVSVVNTGLLHIDSTSSLQVGSFGNGDYTQGDFGVLSIDVGGTTPGTYGQLKVAGTAHLNGSLVLNPVNGFTPMCGDQFQVLMYGSRGSPPSDFTNPPPGFTLSYDDVHGILTAIAQCEAVVV